ncbi:Phosphoinositide phosphatase SAC1 [Golovinomyces cichoracearum]|uniref:Phosphoinositide phosphatase SAC1 n=1 Tax=Golovinomyces cichoracearum TaxID=62708 RepID=A0A420HWD9_9PEZI|nr:Phosphoinositide phosphatase SAC1 [Golovinomyces cichoracearum]
MARLPFRDINVHASSSHYAFTSPSSPSEPTLVVERSSGNIRLSDVPLLGGKRVTCIAGILGIIKLRLDKYIIIITKAQQAGRLKGHLIYKIVTTELLPLRERALHDQDEDTYIALLENFLKSGPMYFSYSMDLTNSFQRQSQSDVSSPLWKRADDRFFWNRFVQSDLVEFRTSGTRQQPGPQAGADPYILPVIFGMLKIVPTSIKNFPLTIALISRRSRRRAGTRYFSRGLDEKGNVSNFNETEQIVVLNDTSVGLGGFGGNGEMQDGKFKDSRKEYQILSYVQTRGSVPVYWAEVNTLFYTPRLQIQGVEAAAAAARAHFEEQIKLYGDIYLLNLVKQNGREQAVKDAYEKMFKLLTSQYILKKEQGSFIDGTFRNKESSHRQQSLDRLHYEYFDFQKETKGSRLHRTDILLKRLMDVLEMQQYFRGVSMPGDADLLDVRNQQKSVFRTNCMDCLDRTNVIQSILASHVLNRQLIAVGVLKEHETLESDLGFEVLFRNLWADNADCISSAYSGTGALGTDLTRTGNRTKIGMFQDLNNSITRYVKNNFLDGPRQDAFDLFMGIYIPSTGSELVFVDKRPLLIQSIPYILAFSIFFVMVGICSRPFPGTALLPIKIFTMFWFIVGVWSFVFILKNGMLYVNWPRFIPRPWATEGYQEAYNNILKDKIMGPLVTRRERGLSTARYTNAEEGKKRIE